MSEVNQAVKGVVLYCDGGARPSSQGFIGWGSHGYIYEVNELKKPFIVDSHLITNKGYLPIAKSKGDELQVEPISYIDFIGSELGEGSNNKAELLAFYNSVTRLLLENITEFTIIADSEYLVKGVTTYLKNWHSNNYIKSDGNRVANVDIWSNIHALLKELEEKEIKLDLMWIKGHNGHLGNVQADMYASIGVNMSSKGIKETIFNLTAVKGYWKPDVERHPFLNFNRIYFNTLRESNTSGIYYQSNPSKKVEFMIGKRLPATSFSVIRLTEPDLIIEDIRNLQCDLTNGFNVIASIKLDQVYNALTYKFLNEFGPHCLVKDRRNFNLNFIDNKPVTVEMNPVGLTYRAIEAFNYLDDALDQYLEHKEGRATKPDHIFHHDITDQFFNKETKTVKKEEVEILVIKPELMATTDMTLTIKQPWKDKEVELKIPYILGLDTLTRNGLKKIESENPTITLYVWFECEISMRYATIITCDSGKGIWSNFFSDKIFLK